MLLAALLLNYSLADAQSTPEQKPDVSNKALITKSSPAPAKAGKEAKAAPMKQYTIEQFMDTTRVGGSSFSPDEKSILFHSNGRDLQCLQLPVAGGAAEAADQLHQGEHLRRSPIFPADARFLYTYDKGGNENSISTCASWTAASAT